MTANNLSLNVALDYFIYLVSLSPSYYFLNIAEYVFWWNYDVKLELNFNGNNL